jgi:hypothetical protein
MLPADHWISIKKAKGVGLKNEEMMRAPRRLQHFLESGGYHRLWKSRK